MFTFFGQFFDHGVDQTVKGGGTVFVPLKADDPLIAGRTSVPATRTTRSPVTRTSCRSDQRVHGADPRPEPARSRRHPRRPRSRRRTRAPTTSRTPTTPTPRGSTRARPTPRTPRTRCSCASTPRSAGKPRRPPASCSAAWRPARPTRARPTDAPAWRPGRRSRSRRPTTCSACSSRTRTSLNVPMLATDPYGEFIPGTERPAAVRHARADGTAWLEGDLADPGARCRRTCGTSTRRSSPTSRTTPTRRLRTPTTTRQPTRSRRRRTATARRRPTSPHQPAGTYDDEMLDAHFCAGDGRVNENIALTTIHQVFHSEHDRLVDDIQNTLDANPDPAGGLPGRRPERAPTRPPRPSATATGSSRRLASSPRWSTSTWCSRSSVARCSRRSGRSTSTRPT